MDDADKALDMAQARMEAGDDVEARRWAEKSARLRPSGNPAAAVLLAWLDRFGHGSVVDRQVRAVLAAPDLYAVLSQPRFVRPDPGAAHKEYLRLSRMLHPDKSGARRTEEACKRVTEAFTTLKDEGSRSKYDARLQREQGQNVGGQPGGRSNATGSLRQAVEAIPTVAEMLHVAEKLGLRSNARQREKLAAQVLEELRRLSVLNRREGDDTEGRVWAFERLASLKHAAKAVVANLRQQCLVACAAGSSADLGTLRDLMNEATDRSLDPAIVLRLEERIKTVRAAETPAQREKRMEAEADGRRAAEAAEVARSATWEAKRAVFDAERRAVEAKRRAELAEARRVAAETAASQDAAATAAGQESARKSGTAATHAPPPKRQKKTGRHFASAAGPSAAAAPPSAAPAPVPVPAAAPSTTTSTPAAAPVPLSAHARHSSAAARAFTADVNLPELIRCGPPSSPRPGAFRTSLPGRHRPHPRLPHPSLPYPKLPYLIRVAQPSYLKPVRWPLPEALTTAQLSCAACSRGLLEPGPGVLSCSWWGMELQPAATLTPAGEIRLPAGVGDGRSYTPTSLLQFLAKHNRLYNFNKGNGWAAVRFRGETLKQLRDAL